MPDQKEKANISEEKSDQTLDPEKIKEYLENLKDWQLSSDEKKISKTFNFKNFREIIEFFNSLAVFALKIKHYPDVTIIRFPKVTVELTSPDIGGLSKEDFLLAQEAEDAANWKVRFEQWVTSSKVLIILLIVCVAIILWQYFR